MTTTTTATVPMSELDLYSDEVIRDPYDAYRELREQGPVVWLEKVQAYVLTRYAEVREATENWQVFSSAEGVSLTAGVNALLRGSTIASDPPLHDHLRSVSGEKLTPRSLRPMREPVSSIANDLVDILVERGSFDAVVDFARVLPMTVVPDFIGVPEEAREHLLPWAGATFDAMGPENARCVQSMPMQGQLFGYAAGLAASRDLRPDSLGAGILDAVDSGKVEAAQAPGLLLDYLSPGLDTTISSLGSALWLFGRSPEQWDRVRADPSLIPNAYNEIIRLETPVRAFSRYVTQDTDVAGFAIPEGSRVLLLWASANRDERQFEKPDEFDVTRENANSHLGFGFGTHGCAGQGLARIEGHALLTALANSVERITIGAPVHALNNTIRALASLPVTITRAKTEV
jgi:cytochrome P450